MSSLKSPEGSSRRYWRSVGEIAGESAKHAAAAPAHEHALRDNRWSRRNFLTVMGASLAMAGLTSCRKPVEKIVPYVHRPEGMTPGESLSYATTMPMGTTALGLLVTSHDGRPTKIDGNSLHPSSGGATNIFAQAELLNLYDPDRSQSVRQNNREVDWTDFVGFQQALFTALKKSKGEGLAVLSEPFASPTLARLQKEFHKTFPKARWVSYEPVNDENIRRGLTTAFGQSVRPLYHFSKAEVIVSLDSDFLQYETDAVRNTAGFTSGRRVETKEDGMNRLYQIEANYSLTGSMADHRLRLPSSRIASFALALLRELQAQGVRTNVLQSITAAGAGAFDDKWLKAVAADLKAHRGRCLVLAGRNQPPVVHALVGAINEALGNIGRTVDYYAPGDSTEASVDELRGLVADMHDGHVTTLLLLGGNPVYNAPADLEFAKALKKVKTSIHLSSHVDETSRRCSWHIHRTHFLETWGDVRWTDGTVSPIQPLIAPLFDSHSDIDVLALMASGRESSAYDEVRRTWRKFIKSDFEGGWRRALHDGLLAASSGKPESVRTDRTALSSAVNNYGFKAAPVSTEAMEVVFTPSNVYDGRYANNGWLQELPDPVTKLTWDNVAQVSVRTGKALGVKNGQMVRLSVNERELILPVWISPGIVDNCVVLSLGYGRRKVGRIAEHAGFDTYRLRTTSGFTMASGAKLTPLSETYPLAQTQEHGQMEGRPLAREATLAAFREQEGEESPFKPEQTEHPPLLSLWNEHSYDQGYQWGMSIDLNACTGCNACVVACQSENNIPVVGKERVSEGREMQWIRIDRYYSTNEEGTVDPDKLDEAEISMQPVNCQHCENAPCESVCPVAATVHDSEGLNVMVYNRCIGTRYCSNNCPYKVRRFNFFNYTKDLPELVQMAQNPEVTVRFRGVMEKCSYCVQRITMKKIDAKNEGRTLADGEVVTACQQVCPAKAITFGNINDPDSKVAREKKSDRNYNLLEWLNVKPRTSYLAKLRNPNPELAG